MRRASGWARGAMLTVLMAAAIAAFIGGWAGVVLGLLVGPVLGVTTHRWLAGQPSRAQAREDQQVKADLPFAADLLAAALRAGAAPDLAARCVGRALPGPLGERLLRVDRALSLGAAADEAWAYLGSVPGASRLVQAAVRSQHSGAAFAGSLQRVAEDLRADLLTNTDAAARRAAVLIVLPLGLCFLPAFVLAGLVPVIVAVLSGVLSP